jgi:formylmethanofuran dehydrogenase subunit E
MQKSKVKRQKLNSKFKSSKILKSAVDFHGHLGPYLILGILMGDLAIKRLKCKKHFGIKAMIKGAINKPKSCLIDGIQISTGCTYGKGNIQKIKGDAIGAVFHNLRNNKKIKIFLNEDLIGRLNSLNGHKSSESFAKELLRINPAKLFEVNFNS